jgi:hypothetical protein
MCGRIYLGGEVIYKPVVRLRLGLPCVRFDVIHCKPEPVTEKRLRAITGSPERDLLTHMYEVLRRRPDGTGRTALAEVDRRLGLAPVRPAASAFEQVKTFEVAEALRVFASETFPATPVVDAGRVHLEYALMSRVWNSRRLWTGTLEEALVVLRANLEDDTRQDFESFLIDVMPADYCAQISTLFTSTFTGYRVWRGADRVFLCGGSRAML